MRKREANPNASGMWGGTRTNQNGFWRGWFRRDLETYEKTVKEE